MSDDRTRATVVLERAGRRIRAEPGSAAERRALESGFAPAAGPPDYAGMTWFALLAAVRRLGFQGRTKAEALAFLRRRGLPDDQKTEKEL